MRENQFRAWWVHPESDSRGFDYFSAIEGFTLGDMCQELIDVQEFIGRRDKNGKEVCEGDIYRQTWKEEVITGVIVYYLHGFWIQDLECEHIRYGEIKLTGEVIGNDHENPELLGGYEINE